MSDSEPFYMPSPDLFGHADAYPMYTRYAAELEKAGLAGRFPAGFYAATGVRSIA